MTPHEFARRECANMRPDGGCFGIRREDLFGRGQLKIAMPLPRCVLARMRGTSIVPKRCPYFEKVILPLADHPSPKGDPGLQARRLDARQRYRQTVGELAKPTERGHRPDGRDARTRTCGECQKPIGKGRRFCDTCRDRRRRETQRRKRQEPRSGRHS